MALHVKSTKSVVGITAFGQVITSIRQGANLIWEAVRSCFGSGRWVRSKPWLHKEGWKHK